jgi:hypothetical protein
VWTASGGARKSAATKSLRQDRCGLPNVAATASPMSAAANFEQIDSEKRRREFLEGVIVQEDEETSEVERASASTSPRGPQAPRLFLSQVVRSETTSGLSHSK